VPPPCSLCGVVRWLSCSHNSRSCRSNTLTRSQAIMLAQSPFPLPSPRFAPPTGRPLGACRPLFHVAVALAIGCSSGPDEQVRCDGGQAIPVTVSSPHAQPRFSWASACPIWTLQVSYVDSTSTVVPVWAFATPAASNTVRPPITYGIVPPGADAPLPPITLVPGRGYTVRVSAWDSVHGVPAFVGLGSFVH
jgi:hypothetical protein